MASLTQKQKYQRFNTGIMDEIHDTSLGQQLAFQALEGTGEKTQAKQKSRFISARESIPTGNFDWAEHKSIEHYRQTKKAKDEQWSLAKKITVAIAILIALALIGLLVVKLLNQQNGLNQTSVDPIIPTFPEVSGKITATKIQPLTQQKTSHFLRHLLEIS